MKPVTSPRISSTHLFSGGGMAHGHRPPLGQSAMVFRAMGGASKKKGCVLRQKGNANIKAVLKDCHEHADGSLQTQKEKFRCFRERGLSDDKTKQLAFESTFYFTVEPPKTKNRVYWVHHKLTRTLICFCPEEQEQRRYEQNFDEYFRVRSTSTTYKQGSSGDQKNLDHHWAAKDYEFPCPGTPEPPYCRMDVLEVGDMTLEECSADEAGDTDYLRAKETTESSMDPGKIWTDPVPAGEGQQANKIPRGMSPTKQYATPYSGHYEIEYYMVHCDPYSQATQTPVTPGGHPTAAMLPVTFAASMAAAVPGTPPSRNIATPLEPFNRAPPASAFPGGSLGLDASSMTSPLQPRDGGRVDFPPD